jgi:hypothetical protein
MAVAPPNVRQRAGAGSPTGAAAHPPARAAWTLLAAVAACLLYAAFADGATELPAQSRLQLALGAVATAACAGWLYGNGLALRAGALGWTGFALLAGFAAWTGASIAWSVAPDRSWTELNRGLAYVLALFAGLVIGSSLPRAPERVGRMLALVSLPVALYALGGKTLPGVHLGELIDFNHAGGYNRLKAPLEYWNALALFCVTGLLPMLRLAADPHRRPWPRVAALVGVLVLVLVVGLTYSRGGIIALVAGLVVLVSLTTERVRTVVLFLSALVASAAPLAIALSSDDLTADVVPLARREDDALAVLVAVAVMSVLLAAWGRALIAAERRLTPERGRATGRPVAIAAGVVLALGTLTAVATGRVSEAFDSFKSTETVARQTDPNRLLSNNSGNRWTWWKEAAGAWSAKPVAGWGAGSFPVTHKLYRREPLSVQQPHSVPLQWLAETGVVGLLLAGGALLALLAAALAGVRREPWAIRAAPPGRGAAAALLAVAAAWLAHAFYDWDWGIPAVTLPMLLCLGVLAARPATARVVGGRGPALVAAGVAFVLIAVSAVLPALARTRTSAALAAVGGTAPSEARLAGAAADAELASRLNPLAVEPLFAAATIAERRGRTDDARARLLEALGRQPYSVDAWFRLVRLDFGRLDRAALIRESERALELDPVNPATIGLARRAQASSALPEESATATGSPLPAPTAASP